MDRVKVLMLGIIAILAVAFFGSLLSTGVFRTRAAETRVGYTFVPKTVTTSSAETQTVDLVIAPEKSNNFLSGVDVTMEGHNLEILNVGEPIPLGQASDAVFTPAVRTIEAQKARVMYVATQATTFPQALKLQVVVKLTGTGNGVLTLDSNALTATGPENSPEYGVGTVDALTLQQR